MSVRRVGLWTGLVAAAGLCLPASVFAQDIRSYGGDESSQSGGGGGGGGSGGSQMYYPGQPTPNQGGQSGNAKGGDSEKKKQGDSGSYRIRIHGSAPGAESPDQEQSTSLSAVEMLEKSPDKLYSGVIPGVRDVVDHLEETREDGETESRDTGPNRLTWLGFKPERDRTRVFLQTSRSPEYDLERQRDSTRLVLTLPDTRLSSRNFSRSIDTSYFERNVQRIRAREGSDQTVRIEIELDAPASPAVSTSGNYLYVDFPAESDSSSQKQASRSERNEE